MAINEKLRKKLYWEQQHPKKRKDRAVDKSAAYQSVIEDVNTIKSYLNEGLKSKADKNHLHNQYQTKNDAKEAYSSLEKTIQTIQQSTSVFATKEQIKMLEWKINKKASDTHIHSEYATKSALEELRTLIIADEAEVEDDQEKEYDYYTKEEIEEKLKRIDSLNAQRIIAVGWSGWSWAVEDWDYWDIVVTGSWTIWTIQSWSHTHTASEVTDLDTAAITFTNKSGNISQWTNDAWYITSTLSDEQVQDVVGAMLTSNTETLISVTYQDSDGTIDFVVDNNLANYDNTTSWFITWITSEPLSDLSDVTITTIASGEILKRNWSERINNTLAEAWISSTSHTHAASAITVTPTWNLASSDVQAWLQELQWDIDTINSSLWWLTDAVVLKWTWDASSWSFPWSWSAQAWWSYIVSVAGTVDSTSFAQNDRILAITDNASTSTYASNWHKLDYTDQVLSVNGSTGAVVLDPDDLDDTSTTNKFVTATQKSNRDTAYWRGDHWAAGYLTSATAASTYQPLDSDLTTIAGLTATTNNFIQSVSSAWASRTPAQVTATLDAMVGDSWSGWTKWLAPAPAAGDAAASKFLKADWTWSVPTWSGNVSKVWTPVDNQIWVWTWDGTIEGTSDFTFDWSDLTFYDATNNGNPEIRLGGADAEELHIQTVYDTWAQTLDYVLFTTDVASATANKWLFRFNVDWTNILDIDDWWISWISWVTWAAWWLTIDTVTNGDITISPWWSWVATVSAGSGGVTISTNSGNSDISLSPHGTGSVNIAASKDLSFGWTSILSDSAWTMTLANIDAIDATTESTIEAAIDTLANLTSIQWQTVSLSWSLTVESASTINQDLTTDASPQFTGVNVWHASDTTITRVSAGVAAIEWVTIATSSNTLTLTNKTFDANGTGNSLSNVEVADLASSAVAAASDLNTWTSTTKLITPDALAWSNYGIEYFQLAVFDWTTDVATWDGKYYFHIPPKLNGRNLVYTHAEVITAWTTGTTDIQIANVTDAVDVLSTKLTIDSTETGSDTAATAAVINTSNDDAATNDLWRVDVDAVSTTAPKWLIVTLWFQLP